MVKKEYSSIEERETLMNEYTINLQLFLVAEENIATGNFLTFDDKPLPTGTP